MNEVLAIGCSAVSVVVIFALRTWLHHRRTGDTGWRGFRADASRTERLGLILFIVGLIAGVAAPVLARTSGPQGLYEPGPATIALGVALWAAGTLVTFAAQAAMGRSWRIGVDPDEHTDLVAAAMFRLVRNPIFVAMIITQAGIVILVPSSIAISGFVLVLAAIQIQVRLVEEPYLLATHGRAYERYKREVGRFLPRLPVRTKR